MTTLRTRKPKTRRSISGKAGEARALPTPQPSHPLDSVIGIFRDEPLMDALMDRVRADRRSETEADPAE